ncbi:MAG: hypothetical protein WAU65_02745 [Candidatus Nanoarchaeia archaeon]
MEKRGQYYPTKRRSGVWILLLIIVVGVVIYANSQGIIHLSLPSLGNLSLGSNSVQACVQKVNNCSSIINLKYGTNVTVLNDSQAQSASDANSFLSTWKGSSQQGNISSYNVTAYPIVLVATRFDNSNGKSPYVFICKSDGNLEEKSSLGLC